MEKVACFQRHAVVEHGAYLCATSPPIPTACRCSGTRVVEQHGSLHLSHLLSPQNEAAQRSDLGKSGVSRWAELFRGAWYG